MLRVDSLHKLYFIRVMKIPRRLMKIPSIDGSRTLLFSKARISSISGVFESALSRDERCTQCQCVHASAWGGPRRGGLAHSNVSLNASLDPTINATINLCT